MLFSLARAVFPLLALLAVVSAASNQQNHHHYPTVYLLRHGEKPFQKGNHHLNSDGYKRASCLRSLFAADSPYDIGYILAPRVSSDGNGHRRSVDTVFPLAKDLGVPVDTCKHNDSHCVAKRIRDYHKKGNVIISWRHGVMKDIVKDLGVENPPDYPDERYDLVWTIPYPYTNVTEIWSEKCPGLDYGVDSELLKVQG